MGETRGQPVSGDAERFFRDLFARAFPDGSVRLESAAAVIGRGWRIGCTLTDGAHVEIDLSPPGSRAAAMSRNFGFSHGPIGPQHAKAAFAACRILAEADVASPPSELTSIPRPVAEPAPPAPVIRGRTVNIKLPGVCDRSCMFCADRYGRVESPETYVDGGRRWELRVVQDRVQLERHRARVRQALLEAAAEDPPAVVWWSGMDCLASPLLGESLELAHELGLGDMSVQTPGTRLAEDGFVADLARRGVTTVSLTAHASSPELFDHVGGKDGAHAAFWAGVDNVLGHDLALRVAVPVIQQNLHEVPALVERLAALDARVSVFYWYEDPETPRYFAEMAVPYGDAAALLANIRGRTEPGRIEISGVPPCVVSSDLREHFRWDYSRKGGHHAIQSFRSIPECNGCPHQAECPGVVGMYLEAFGASDLAR